MIIIIICTLLFVIYALLMLVYAYGWHRQQHPDVLPGTILPVNYTVIIPARNEADNIAACINSIINNDWYNGTTEIIVIDDFSTDGTGDIASVLLAGGKGRVLRLEDYLTRDQRLNSYKKKALEIAIGMAVGDWIITTDADCIVPAGWLENIDRYRSSTSPQFIAAPVSFTPAANRKNLLYYFQSLDFMTMQGVTAASARLNLSNMCNGANLAFSKKAFNEVGGYQGIDHIASGDDMLLMHKIQLRYPSGIRYLKSDRAIVQTPAQPDWKSFLNQRIRWSSKADKYDDKKLTWILAGIYFFNVSFIVLLLAGFFNSFYWLWLSGTIFAKVLVELAFLIPVAKFYGKTNELIYFPLLQPLHILYIIAAGFLGKFGTYEWKGRKVK